MTRLHEAQSIREVLEHGDAIILTTDIQGTWAGVAVEIGSGNTPANAFEGTLVYFPGITLQELKG